ncbi:MAG: 2,3-diphosphoglycerate synthetase [Actinomycetota bacterium]
MVALIDGEHYFPVIQAALEEIERDALYHLVAAVFLGGTEKVTEQPDFSFFKIPIVTEPDPVAGILKAIRDYQPELVIDLSDEPVVGYKQRFDFACQILKFNVSYLGSDFRFDPPIFLDIVQKPSMSIIGTGKRTGKTAVSAYICRELKKAGRNPCVVAMGRGGPPEPEVLDGAAIKMTPEYLLEASRLGKHAASDHYEDAMMSRITTIGCRRCGGGMAGKPYISNVPAGARIANNLEEELIIFEGSGAAFPSVKTDGMAVVIGAGQPEEYILGYFGPYRLFLSDLAILTMCEEPMADQAKISKLSAGIKEINPEIRVVQTIFRPRPLEDISGRRVFFATTAPPSVGGLIKTYLEEKFDCKVTGISHNLSNRPRLRKDIQEKEGQFDLLLTELKAASVDVVTMIGLDWGVQVVYADNIPVTVGGDGDLKDLLLDLAEKAISRFRDAKRPN